MLYQILYEDEVQSLNATFQFGPINQRPETQYGYVARCEVIDLVNKTSTVYHLGEKHMENIIAQVFNMVRLDSSKEITLAIKQIVQ